MADVGTMGPEPEIGKLEHEKGSLYTLINKKSVKKHLSKVSISNGLAWNMKLKKMYYIDSPLRTIDQYDYDSKKGEICMRGLNFNPKQFFTITFFITQQIVKLFSIYKNTTYRAFPME